MATKDVTAALRYTPPVQQAMRRSEYLTDALKTMQASGGDIKGGWGELAAKLGATYLLSRKADKAQDALVQALRGEQQAKAAKMGAEIDGWGGAQAPSSLPPAYTPTPIAPPQVPVNSAPLPPAAKPMAQYSPDDRQALALMLYTEAANESPDGMAAAGHVALNRLNTGYGGAKSLKDVVYAKHQFEGMTSPRANVSPNDPAFQRSQQVADAILAGQLPDPTGGAVNFINPELQAQLGRQQPSWAPQGQGQRIGRHVFYGGKPQAPGAPPPQQAQNLTQPGPMQDQPFQVASNGPIPIPSAPASQPGGTPPGGAPLPQAGAPPGVTTWRPTPQQVTLVKRLLSSSDPADVERGTTMFYKMQEMAAQPVKYDNVVVNNVPMQIDPYTGARRTLGGIPVEAQDQTYNSQQLAELFGIQKPPGTIGIRSPTGGFKFEGPPQGQMVTSQPGQPYREGFVPGGQNDPTRPQAPASGYQWNGQGQQAPISGSQADPKNPMNVIEGTQRFSGQIKTIVDSAMKVKQNYGAVQTGYQAQNGTGDITMINGVQRLIDEGVVKAEDVTAQMKSNGLEGTMGGWASYAKSEGMLTPEIRDKVYKVATDLYRNLDQTYRVRVTSMRGPVDEAYGPGTFDKYVFPTAFAQELGWTAEAPVDDTGQAKGWSGQLTAAQRATAQRLAQSGGGAPGTAGNPLIASDLQTASSKLKPGTFVLLMDGSVQVVPSPAGPGVPSAGGAQAGTQAAAMAEARRRGLIP